MNPIDGLMLTRHFSEDGDWVEVVHAAPQATFSAEVLRAIRHGGRGLDVTLDRLGIGAILRIRARDRTLVYRIVEHDDERDTFTGVWPD